MLGGIIAENKAAVQVCSLNERFTSVPGTSGQSSRVPVRLLLQSAAQRTVEW